MKRISSVVAFTTLIAFSSLGLADASPLDDARTLVSQAHLGKKLASLALLTAKSTATYAAIAAKVGNASANSAVSDEINALLPKYQPKWDENLARAYEGLFSEEELSSLASEGRHSKYAPKVKERREEVGGYMQKNAEPILVALVSEALKVTLSQTAKGDS